ncbi:hypothetical protein ACNPQM_11220 [Streptomyces sp. NPDC056231]|uniref:hypothetical protein n=1 Tax=Streptomyces sp. NPDC056231 TaxID=3345755 RepID=UPI003AAE2E26
MDGAGTITVRGSQEDHHLARLPDRRRPRRALPPTDSGKDPYGPKYVHRRVADAVYTGVGGYGMYAK